MNGFKKVQDVTMAEAEEYLAKQAKKRRGEELDNGGEGGGKPAGEGVNFRLPPLVYPSPGSQYSGADARQATTFDPQFFQFEQQQPAMDQPMEAPSSRMAENRFEMSQNGVGGQPRGGTNSFGCGRRGPRRQPLIGIYPQQMMDHPQPPFGCFNQLEGKHDLMSWNPMEDYHPVEGNLKGYSGVQNNGKNNFFFCYETGPFSYGSIFFDALRPGQHPPADKVLPLKTDGRSMPLNSPSIAFLLPVHLDPKKKQETAAATGGRKRKESMFLMGQADQPTLSVKKAKEQQKIVEKEDGQVFAEL